MLTAPYSLLPHYEQKVMGLRAAALGKQSMINNIRGELYQEFDLVILLVREVYSFNQTEFK